MKPSQPEFITIGKILAPWGTRGKLKVEVATDFPQRFTPQAKVYINRQPMTITSTDWHQAQAIIELKRDGNRLAEMGGDGRDQLEKNFSRQRCVDLYEKTLTQVAT